MFRYQLLIEYLGTNYKGWQIQKKNKTIQGILQDKIRKLLKENITIVGSCLLYTSPSPRDPKTSRMPSSA